MKYTFHVIEHGDAATDTGVAKVQIGRLTPKSGS